MITHEDQPLQIARRVLKASTIQGLARSTSFTLRAWKILDRWAYNSPAKLIALEAKGEFFLLEKLLQQQQLEHEALTQPDPQMEGMSEHEILKAREIKTEL